MNSTRRRRRRSRAPLPEVGQPENGDLERVAGNSSRDSEKEELPLMSEEPVKIPECAS